MPSQSKKPTRDELLALLRAANPYDWACNGDVEAADAWQRRAEALLGLPLGGRVPWLDIASAPTDGTPILGWVPGYGCRLLVWVMPYSVPDPNPPGYKEAPCVWRLVGGAEVYSPTKWHPVPDEPVDDDGA